MLGGGKTEESLPDIPGAEPDIGHSAGFAAFKQHQSVSKKVRHGECCGVHERNAQYVSRQFVRSWGLISGGYERPLRAKGGVLMRRREGLASLYRFHLKKASSPRTKTPAVRFRFRRRSRGQGLILIYVRLHKAMEEKAAASPKGQCAVHPTLEVDDASSDFSNPGRAASGSSILDESAIHEHGRTYQSYKQDAYLLPNDGEEQDRLDLQHHTINLLLDGKLAFAPIGEPENVLDVATGTGVWAVEFARDHPRSKVIGSDLSLIQPNGAVENCSFVKEDAENDEWTYDCQFDYIHLRLLFTCFNDISLVLRKIYSNLKPGGWVEFQDHTPEILSPDGTTVGSAMETFGHKVVDGLSAVGRNATRIKYLDELLKAEGFVSITKRVLPYPVGRWPQDPKYKEVGMWMAQNVVLGLDGTVKMLVAGGMSTADVRVLVEQVKSELQSGHVHAYCPFYVIYAQKPEETASGE